MPFWRCYYHLIWATKNRAAWISPQVESAIIAAVREKANTLESPILAANTVADHMHIAVSVPPKLAIAEWVRQIKGAASRSVNEQFPALETAFGWQGSYGVLTFGAKHLEFVVSYVERQKEHHANNTLERYLEQIDDEN
jgi:putative transposase